MLLATDTISLERLSIALIPAIAVLFILYAWAIEIRTSIYAILRMLLQLLLIGYLLHFVFQADTPLVIVGAITIMLLAATWISLRVAANRRKEFLGTALLSIVCGGGITLLVITQGVLQLDPWYLPQKMIPLAGMIFSNCMNSVSLAVERFDSEVSRGVKHAEACRTSLQASLIPITNSLFAVGLVSIPGMMTGQVLANVPPATAARYQIMVMCMMFASSGLSTSLFLKLISKPKSGPLSTSEAPATGVESPEA